MCRPMAPSPMKPTRMCGAPDTGNGCSARCKSPRRAGAHSSRTADEGKLEGSSAALRRATDRVHVLARLQTGLVDFLRSQVFPLAVLAHAVQLLRLDRHAIVFLRFLALIRARLGDVFLHRV